MNYIKVWQRRINTTSGTREGGMKAAKTNYERHGNDFYKKLGRMGGSAPTDKLKGFAANPELAKVAGAIGGRKSKRGPSKNKKV